MLKVHSEKIITGKEKFYIKTCLSVIYNREKLKQTNCP